MTEIEQLIDEYVRWFRNEINIKKINDFAEISTPFLDKNNDNVTLYVKIEGDKVRISDDGYYISNLCSYGVNITTKRRKIIKSICAQNGVEENRNEIFMLCNRDDYPKYMHSMIQTILSIDDLYDVSSSRVAGYFYDDVVEYFDNNEIYYSENVSFTGKSLLNHKYDFLFQRTKQQPERLCKIINNATKTMLASTIFSWEDTKTVRKKNTKLYVLINDSNKIEKGVLEGFNAYNINTYKWSQISQNSAAFK